jgi:hypothetical protein
MSSDSVGRGVAIAILLALATLVLSFAGMAILPGDIGNVAVWSFWGIGLTQLLYAIPLYIHWNQSKPATAKGLVIGASIIALLNASCWGSFFFIFRG